MTPEISQFITLLTERCRAYRLLSREVAAAQEACVVLDIEGIQIHDLQKLRLCAELRRVDLGIAEFKRSAAYQSLSPRLAARQQPAIEKAAADDLGATERMRQLWYDSEAARVEAGRRNEVYAAFLQRAGSTLKVMTNIVSHCLGVYPPAFEGAATLPTEGGL
ncbi:MAG: hypothetical protein ACRD11_13220 [Terriglobia bacterium]